MSGMGQVAKIRKDATSGYVIASTGNGNINGAEVSYIVIPTIPSRA